MLRVVENPLNHKDLKYIAMYHYCEGIGCALRERCERYVTGCRIGRQTPGYHWIASCDDETRECYMPVSD